MSARRFLDQRLSWTQIVTSLGIGVAFVYFTLSGDVELGLVVLLVGLVG